MHGVGGNFSAGFDLNELSAAINEPAKFLTDDVRAFVRSTNTCDICQVGCADLFIIRIWSGIEQIKTDFQNHL